MWLIGEKFNISTLITLHAAIHYETRSLLLLLAFARTARAKKLSTSEPVDEDDFKVSAARVKEKLQSEEDAEVLKSERLSDFTEVAGVARGLEGDVVGQPQGTGGE